MISVVVGRLAVSPSRFDVRTITVVALYVAVMTVLSFASVMHLTARLGAAHRFARHAPAPVDELRRFFAAGQPSMTVLIPSYREETKVIRRTVLSAALQEYRDLRVVLLIDDPPTAPAGSHAGAGNAVSKRAAATWAGDDGLPAVIT